MNEEEQDAMIRRLADETLRPPPVPREEIWGRIQAARAGTTAPAPVVHRLPVQWRVLRIGIGMAALVALAFGLGRYTARTEPGRTPLAAAPVPVSGTSAADRLVATDYLGHAEVFLTDFRAAARSGRPDSSASAEARRLLGTARLLLDSRAAEDVRLRALLEDLELVLAEISQLSAAPHNDVKLITEGLDRRGTLGRLRAAVPAGDAPVTTQGVS
jgi:hypothetical protein